MKSKKKKNHLPDMNKIVSRTHCQSFHNSTTCNSLIFFVVNPVDAIQKVLRSILKHLGVWLWQIFLNKDFRRDSVVFKKIIKMWKIFCCCCSNTFHMSNERREFIGIFCCQESEAICWFKILRNSNKVLIKLFKLQSIKLLAVD